MPRYRVKALSFINDRMVQAGEVIEYDGNPSPDNLEPLDAEGVARMDAWLEAEDRRLLGPDPADEPAPADLASMVQAAMADALAAVRDEQGAAKAVKAKPVV